LAQPQGHGLKPRAKTLGSYSQVTHEEAFKGEKRFVIKDHIVNVLNDKADLFQTAGDSLAWKPWIMFLAGEALFLGSCRDSAVPDKTCGTVMIKT
jgi:hypothetical protein